MQEGVTSWLGRARVRAEVKGRASAAAESRVRVRVRCEDEGLVCVAGEVGLVQKQTSPRSGHTVGVRIQRREPCWDKRHG